jgi:ABC-type sugar transport system ATPase subunit
VGERVRAQHRTRQPQKLLGSRSEPKPPAGHTLKEEDKKVIFNIIDSLTPLRPAKILSCSGIVKRFPGVVALDSVSVDFEAGSCHALMGENGAGKSTLGKLLAGIYSPDAGSIQFEGQPVFFRGPQDATKAGISMVHQELLFAENLSVAENLNLGELPAKGIFLDRKEMNRRASEFLATIGANIDPNQLLGTLPISKQQLVQIAAGVGRGAKVLIFDEPTSSLSQAEAARLLETIKGLQSKGVTCIYVSHRLEEVFEICDAVTILRDGKLVETAKLNTLTRDDLVRKMIGRELAKSLEEFDDYPLGEELLRVEDLSSPGKFEKVSFSLRAGEILGLAGLVGAGRTEVVEALFGLDPNANGRVWIKGKELGFSGPIQSMRAGLGLVPEDRKHHGLVLGMNARENISLPTLDMLSALGWVKSAAEKSLAQKFFERLRVKAPSVETIALGLSGGNQQKLVIAKWLAAQADVMLIDEPTRGVDVGAKAEIHTLVRELAGNGKAVVLVSSDLPELLALATRIVVMRDGRLAGELPKNPGEEPVMRLMAGVA